MGLGNLAGQEEQESSGGNKSTYITFQNPRTADVPDSSTHRHKQEYYDAAKQMRNMLGQDINVPVGEFLAAAVEAEEGDTERLQDLFNEIADEDE